MNRFSRFEREMYRADREWRNVKLPGKGHDKGRSVYNIYSVKRNHQFYVKCSLLPDSSTPDRKEE